MSRFVEFVGDGGSVGGDLLRHRLHGDDRLVVERSLVVEHVPGVAFVRGDDVRRLLENNREATLLECGFEIAEDLNLTHALARAVIPIVILAFESLGGRVAIGVFAGGHLRLILFLVVATVDRAARHAGDERRVFAALGVGGGLVLGNHVGGQ
jgi:hypothetical protein